MGWIPHALLRGMLRLEIGAFCLLPAQSLPALGRILTLRCLFLTTCSHSSSNKNSVSFGLTPPPDRDKQKAGKILLKLLLKKNPKTLK